jgi:membrane associated rhomboid family serine protease
VVLPLYDDNSGIRETPWVNYGLIAVNVFVFVVLQGLGTNEAFTYSYSTVPAKIATGKDIVTPPRPVTDPLGNPIYDPYTGEPVVQPGLGHTYPTVYISLLTSMFMHGGLLHLLGNMLFLWIFGDNVEDTLGHVRYLIFYLICGVLASLAHVGATYAFGGDIYVPSLGASGAISGVLGGYLLRFPTNRVTVLVSYFFLEVPAWAAIGLWFVLQILSAAGVLGEGSQTGGVAYGAHVGGFIAGLALVKPFGLGRATEPPPSETRWLRSNW